MVLLVLVGGQGGPDGPVGLDGLGDLDSPGGPGGPSGLYCLGGPDGLGAPDFVLMVWLLSVSARHQPLGVTVGHCCRNWRIN